MKIFTLKTFTCLALLMPVVAAMAQEGEHHEHHSHHHELKSIKIIHFKFYGGIGGSLYAGEVTGKEVGGILSASKGRPSATLGVAYKLHDRFFVKAEFSYSFLKGVESDATMLKAGRIHNFQFKNNTYDFVVLGQFNILPYTYLRSRKINLVPYVVAGIGLTSSNPQGFYQGHWTSLSDLSNGQIKNNVMAVVPLGLGVLYRINDNWDVGLDATVRYTLGGSLDGDTKNGVNTNTLSADGKAYFDQYYKPGATNALKDHPNYNDLYTVLQIRIQYTFIPEKYKHLFHIKDINNSSDRSHKKLLRMR